MEKYVVSHKNDDGIAVVPVTMMSKEDVRKWEFDLTAHDVACYKETYDAFGYLTAVEYISVEDILKVVDGEEDVRS